MQLTDALCYVLLTLTMASTCIRAEGRKHELEERKIDKRLNRREATLFINSFPERAVDRYQSPKVIYRRYSKQRYESKPSYGSPRPKYTPKYIPPKSNRKPPKKNRSKITPKFSPKPYHKKRAPKPRYGPPKRPVTKPVHGTKKPPKKPHPFSSNNYKTKPAGFAEPPIYDDLQSPDYNDFQTPGLADFQKPSFSSHEKEVNNKFQKPHINDFNKPTYSDFHQPDLNNFPTSYNDFHKQSAQEESFDGFQKSKDHQSTQGYGEPPVDSYGAPIKPSLHDLTYPTAQSFADTSSHFDQDTFGTTYQSWKSYVQDQNIDNKYEFSKKYPAITKPDNELFVTSAPGETDEEQGLNSFSDIFNYRRMKEVLKKPYQNVKIIRRPWKTIKENDDDIIVGGQYAEPPARVITPKFQAKDPSFPQDNDAIPPGDLSYYELSPTYSPYVNYKNSNMAFSPQNLNDAFSSR